MLIPILPLILVAVIRAWGFFQRWRRLILRRWANFRRKHHMKISLHRFRRCCASAMLASSRAWECRWARGWRAMGGALASGRIFWITWIGHWRLIWRRGWAVRGAWDTIRFAAC